jgi:hypothetical protein
MQPLRKTKKNRASIWTTGLVMNPLEARNRRTLTCRVHCRPRVQGEDLHVAGGRRVMRMPMSAFFHADC